MKGGGFGPRTHMQLTPEQSVEYLAYKLGKADAKIALQEKQIKKLVAQVAELSAPPPAINPHKDEG